MDLAQYYAILLFWYANGIETVAEYLHGVEIGVV
jgi:hypothetical protein